MQKTFCDGCGITLKDFIRLSLTLTQAGVSVGDGWQSTGSSAVTVLKGGDFCQYCRDNLKTSLLRLGMQP